MVLLSTLSDFDPRLVDHWQPSLLSPEYVEFNEGNHSSLWITYLEILKPLQKTRSVTDEIFEIFI